MSKDLNKVQLLGRLGQDPELKYTQSGTAVANFSLATNFVWKDKDGNRKEKTEWHNIEVWRGLAETCSNYLKKGSRIFLEGKLATDTWEDENKKKHYKTKIVMEEMIMLDSKGNGGAEPEIVADSESNKDDDLPF